MKSNEAFRASVYARAEREKQRIAARRLKVRNASLSVVMVLLVAAVAVPLARNLRGITDKFTAPAITQEQKHAVNQAALGTRMVLLVGKQAVVLENEAQQKEFVNQYKAAMNLGEDDSAPFPAADTAKAICSTDELSEFLAELPEAAESMRLDYDEAFFEGNDLYAMPMELAQHPASTEEAATTGAADTAAQLSTIPDTAVSVTAVPEETIPDAVSPSNADAPPVSEEPETTGEQSTTALPNIPEGELLLDSVVRVLLLVPVNKG